MINVEAHAAPLSGGKRNNNNDDINRSLPPWEAITLWDPRELAIGLVP